MPTLAMAMETLLRKLLRVATGPTSPVVVLLNTAARVYVDGFDMRHFNADETLVDLSTHCPLRSNPRLTLLSPSLPVPCDTPPW